MTDTFERTSWRGIQIDHPSQWELIRASGRDEPGRCVFADRLDERLDVRWRSVTYVPNLDLMLRKYWRKTQDETELGELEEAPPPWRGIFRRTPQATTAHAGRFFREARLLVEVTILWPEDRDPDLEEAILQSVSTQPRGSPVFLWQAGGMSVLAPAGYDLLESSSKVGHTRWDFGSGPKPQTSLQIERLALPEYWLAGSVGDWLEEDLPKGHRLLRREPVTVNGHPGQRLISEAKKGTLNALRGRRKVQLDVGWQCPVEGRVYRLRCWETSDEDEVSPPPEFEVRCCRPVPAAETFRTQQ